MKPKYLLVASGIAFLAASVAGEPPPTGSQPVIETKPLAIGALQEFGILTRGLYNAGSSNAVEVENDWIDHFGAFLTKEAVVGGRLRLSGGLGGIFQFRKPEIVNAGFKGSQRKGFFIGPTDAQVSYAFGDPDNPVVRAGAGMFMYKYNPDAWNLGEYLFRAGPYPTHLTTGGYAVVNNAAAQLQGFKLQFQRGGSKADLLAITETGMAPLYDWSLAALAGHRFAEGLLEIGGGVNLKRVLQVRPSRTMKRSNANGYFTGPDSKVYTSNTGYYDNAAATYERLAREGGAPGAAAEAASWKAQSDSVQAWLALPEGDPRKPRLAYFSAAGTLLMARASLDIKKAFGSEILGPEDLKLYGEVNVLGTRNYPIFYTKVADRMPIMAGFNLPCFKVLDLFAVQVEHFNSPWMNNTSQVGAYAVNVPYFPSGEDGIMSRNGFNDAAGKDNWKWSILLRKRLGSHATLSGQAASDHLRLTSSNFYYGPQFDHNEVTALPGHWYVMTQISWGI